MATVLVIQKTQSSSSRLSYGWNRTESHPKESVCLTICWIRWNHLFKDLFFYRFFARACRLPLLWWSKLCFIVGVRTEPFLGVLRCFRSHKASSRIVEFLFPETAIDEREHFPFCCCFCQLVLCDRSFYGLRHVDLFNILYDHGIPWVTLFLMWDQFLSNYGSTWSISCRLEQLRLLLSALLSFCLISAITGLFIRIAVHGSAVFLGHVGCAPLEGASCKAFDAIILDQLFQLLKVGRLFV